MTPTLSIIIPIYNSERWLRRCVDSILSQSFRDYELMLIDDGSNDGSWQMCQDYAAKDHRIKCFHKENGGVSSARNLGLEKASGAWLTFADSDDALHDDSSLQGLLDMSKDFKLVVGGISKLAFGSINGGGNSVAINATFGKRRFAKAMLNQKYSYMGYMPVKLFRASIIRKRHLRFDESLAFCEGQLFVTQYVCCPEVKRIRLDTRRIAYDYYLHRESAMGALQAGYNPKFITDFVAYGKIRKAWKTLGDKHIDKLADYNYYRSGMYILRMIKASGKDYRAHEELIRKGFERLAGEARMKDLAEKYEFETRIIDFKASIANRSNEEKARLINDWLHGKGCQFRLLNRNWKTAYVISHCLGKFGISLIINRIGF